MEEIFTPGVLVIVIIISLWELVWKGIAMWRSAKNNHLLWFVFILIFNTAGILPIIYLVFFSDKKTKSVSKKKTKKN